MQRLVMIGRDYPELGSLCLKSLDRVHGCITAGNDPNSPSLSYKGHKDCPNEDGLVVLKENHLWLLAVADGHLGHHSSHAILDGLAQLTKIPTRLGPLSLTLSAGNWIDQTVGGTTLVIACCDEQTGSVFGISFGDSSVVTLGPSGAQIRNQPNECFLRGGGSIDVENGQPFQFNLTQGEIMVLYTDGVNECCYRDPFRSVKLQHLDKIYEEFASNPELLTTKVVETAMYGVEGNPGGQDNIATVTFPF